MSESIEVTFVCERCGAKSIVNPDGFTGFREHGITKKLSGYDYMDDMLLGIKVSVNDGVRIIADWFSDEDRARANVKLLCPACIDKYGDMLRDIAKGANERAKSFLEKKGGDKE